MDRGTALATGKPHTHWIEKANVHFYIIVGILFLLVAAHVGYTVHRSSSEETDATLLAADTLVTHGAFVMSGSSHTYLASGTATVTLSSTAVPTTTAVTFATKPASAPRIFLSLAQSGTYYGAVSCSASAVTTTGFNILVNAQTAEGVTDSMTDPITVHWLAIG